MLETVCMPVWSRWIQVGKDRWHRHKNLSGIMVYFENCLVSSYARGEALPQAAPANEAGCLAIVSFSGIADKRMFHPNPTKVRVPFQIRYVLHKKPFGISWEMLVVDKICNIGPSLNGSLAVESALNVREERL